VAVAEELLTSLLEGATARSGVPEDQEGEAMVQILANRDLQILVAVAAADSRTAVPDRVVPAAQALSLSATHFQFWK
jgi:hypothetical protein